MRTDSRDGMKTHYVRMLYTHTHTRARVTYIICFDLFSPTTSSHTLFLSQVRFCAQNILCSYTPRHTHARARAKRLCNFSKDKQSEEGLEKRMKTIYVLTRARFGSLSFFLSLSLCLSFSLSFPLLCASEGE